MYRAPNLTVNPPLGSRGVGLGREANTLGWANELAAETRSGAALARALVEHVCRMHADGYSDEVLVDSEIWVVGATLNLGAS